MEKSVNTQSVNTKNINIQNVNIKEKLKMYFDLSNDIETLDEQRKIIKEDLEIVLTQSGVDSLSTSLGSISYVHRNYTSIDKIFIESILTIEQKEKAYTQKESKFIKITKSKKESDQK